MNALHRTANGHLYDLWALPRPLTKHWGSGEVWNRICKTIGVPDVAFGKTDGIPDHILSVDKTHGFLWATLPFEDNEFDFGYWDPPYDKLYKPECLEIWRTTKKLAILHTHVYPTSWMKNAKRIATVAITMGPLKQIRCLQLFSKQGLEQRELFT
jgi:hypothetical protein